MKERDSEDQQKMPEMHSSSMTQNPICIGLSYTSKPKVYNFLQNEGLQLWKAMPLRSGYNRQETVQCDAIVKGQNKFQNYR